MVRQLEQWFEKNRLIIKVRKTTAISFHHIQDNNFESPPINLAINVACT